MLLDGSHVVLWKQQWSLGEMLRAARLWFHLHGCSFKLHWQCWWSMQILFCNDWRYQSFRLWTERIPCHCWQGCHQSWRKLFPVSLFSLSCSISWLEIFRATKANGSLIFEVVKPLFGPQEVFLDYWLYYHGNSRIEDRIHSQRISIVVSEYSFM